MSDRGSLANLKQEIVENIYTNENQAVTGDLLQDVLIDAVDTMGVSVSQNTTTGHIDITIGSETTPVASVEEVNNIRNLSFIKELYLDATIVDVSQPFKINNIARNLGGQWYVNYFLKDLDDNTQNASIYTQNESVIKDYFNVYCGNRLCGKILFDWDKFPEGVQSAVDIQYTFNSAYNYQPRLLAQKLENDLGNKLDKIQPIFKWNAENALSGYKNTNNGTDVTISVGQTITLTGPQFYHCCIKVAAGDVIYTRYQNPGSYTIAYPFITDKDYKVLEIIDCQAASHKTIDGSDYIYFTVSKNGYLFISVTSISNQPPIYSNGVLLQENNDLPIKSGFPNIFDYEVAVSLPKSLLISMVESASNGACTVKYDSNGYPSLMYRIPITTIGALVPELGDLDTPHPAFMVNNVQKKHIYAGVFMSSYYNGVPVSWWGLDNIMYSSFSNAKAKCSAKGEGWHLETIWERSLIALLARKYHNTDKPRGNNKYGMSSKEGFEYECVESKGNYIPGHFPNGGQWVNGTQPPSWAHNNTRWGIFDIVGGFHEWCDLAKIDTNGKIYISQENNIGADESDWLDTGVFIAIGNDTIKYDIQQGAPAGQSIYQRAWNVVGCSSYYDGVSENIRKKLALALMCPRLSSEDTQPLFDFDGTIWFRNGIGNCYPFVGGALEYANAGLGFLILSYNGAEEHNNMGNRLFYID